MIAEFHRAAAPRGAARRAHLLGADHSRDALRHNASMLNRFLRPAALIVALALAGCATAPERDARGNPKIERLPEEALARLPGPELKLTAQDLVRLTREGIPPEKIIERFQATHSRLGMPASEIMELGKQGVDRKVLDHVAEAEERARQTDVAEALARRDAAEARRREDEERRRNLYRYYTPPYWPPYWGGYMGAPIRN